jgi:hypothetical protein
MEVPRSLLGKMEPLVDQNKGNLDLRALRDVILQYTQIVRVLFVWRFLLFGLTLEY